MNIDLNTLNSQLGQFASNSTKPTTGEVFSTWLNKNLSDSFSKLGSSVTSGLSQIATPVNSVIGGISGLSGMAQALGSKDKTVRTIGLADSGVQTVSAAADMFVPGSGTALNLINSIGGNLIGTPKSIKQFSVNQGIGSGFGSISSMAEQTKSATGAYSQAGLAGKLFSGSGLNRRVKESNTQQSIASNLMSKQTKMIDAARGSQNMFDLKSSQRQNRGMYNSPNSSITINKNGGIIKPALKYKNGGLINIVVDGSLHSRKHDLKKLDQFKDANITEKGVVVVSKEYGGTLLQHAEVETGELILNREVTEKLNKLFEINDEAAQIEAGKILAYEIVKNTKDNKEKIIKNA